MLTPGTTTYGWHVVRELHQGSMAVTYEVRPEGATIDGVPVPDGRYVLKLMFLRDPAFQERLRRVGEAQRGLKHPHLVDVRTVIDVEGMVGVVSAFVDGTDLATWAQGEHELPEIVTVFRHLVDGLVGAHERGLVHRNLKPQKVLIDAQGVPRIHDFMLGKTLTSDSAAALTQMGTTFGTPQYMSPEQFRGAADVDARADLFSLGCLGFELLTGRRAFDGQGLMDIYNQVSSGEAPAPSSLVPAVPKALDDLIADLLAVDRADRPASARVVAERLDREPDLRALQGLPPLEAPPPPSTTTPPPAPRREPPGETLMPPEDLPVDDDTEIHDELGAPVITAEHLPDLPGPSMEITEEMPADEVAAATPAARPPSAPVPPPPFAAHGATGNLSMGLMMLVVGFLLSAVGLLAAAFVF